ncbi:glycosyltransferase [bacterium]|nr:glycosyltransferase [bacterium]
MTVFFNYLIWLVPVLGTCQLLLLLDNLSRFKRTYSLKGGKRSTTVSVMIPARNEAANIESCIESLKSQTYRNMEVLVFDDCSEDDTAAIATRCIALDQRFRLVSGQGKTEGFAGKNDALRKVVRDAGGEILIFIDADTRLAPKAVEVAVAILEEEKAGLLSLWPRQTMTSPEEKMMMPLLSFTLLAFLPLKFAESSPLKEFTAANGQFMIFSRSAYEKCGGHEALKEEIMDDVRLAQRVKACGERVIIRDAGQLATCRMYDSFEKIWQGFRKNLYPAFNNHFVLFISSLFILAIGHALPMAALLSGLAAGSSGLALAASWQIFNGLAIRVILAFSLKQPLISTLLHPLAISITILMALASYRGYTGEGVVWKGRVYKRG